MNSPSAPLALCWGSLHGVDFRQLADHASKAGFSGITLNTALIDDALDSGFDEAGITRLLEDLGLFVSNIDPLFSWLQGASAMPGDDLIARSSRATVDEVFDLACALDTDLVNAPLGLAQPDSEQQVVDAFGTLCQQAATRGLRVSLEFMPFNAVNDLLTAQRIVGAAGCTNGGIMFDCWHHHRAGGIADDLLGVPPDQLFAVQLDDASTHALPDIIEETLNHRCLPGTGCIDLDAILTNLAVIGAKPRFDVEVFSADLRKLPINQQAEQLFRTSQSTISSAMLSTAPEEHSHE